MLLMNTRRVWIPATLFSTLLAGLYIWRSSFQQASLWRSQTWSRPTPSTPGPGPNNDTLGFGVIYVLTEDPTTWRVQGLLQAANLTGLQIQVPVQTHPSDDDVRAHVGGEPPGGYGPARSLLNHLALMESFAGSEVETALIMEDDVDFGVDIRAQMSLLSRAFWVHAGQPGTPAEEALHPYRDSDWDILWPGHYGMEFADRADVFKYKDPHALPWDHLASEFNHYYQDMAAQSKPGSPQPQQLIFNVAPLSTFAYAITRTHAGRLAEKLRKDRAGVFDSALHIDCKGLFHRCVAPVPQLFHHHRVVGEESLSDKGNADPGVQDMTWYRTKHKYTHNIEWSARCNAAGVGEKLGDRWQCLPGRYDPL